MIDYSLIKLIPADESHREFGYQVKKAAEGPYIARIWGWNDDEQRDFHNREWQETKREIITYDDKPIGTIAITDSEGGTRIGTFFIIPEYQNKGIGSYLLRHILDKADRAGQVTRLKFLKINPVKSLYLRYGFEIVGSDEYFYSAERKPGNKSGMVR
jgi:GNAT superfamily N-acetyltransferase